MQKIPLIMSGRRPGDAEIVYASTSKAEKELNWKYVIHSICHCVHTWGNMCYHLRAHVHYFFSFLFSIFDPYLMSFAYFTCSVHSLNIHEFVLLCACRILVWFLIPYLFCFIGQSMELMRCVGTNGTGPARILGDTDHLTMLIEWAACSDLLIFWCGEYIHVDQCMYRLGSQSTVYLIWVLTADIIYHTHN